MHNSKGCVNLRLIGCRKHTLSHSHPHKRHLFSFPGTPAAPPLPSPLSLLVHPSPFQSSLLCSCDCVVLKSDVLFGGFCQVFGPGPPAPGPLLHLGQLAAVVSYGGDQLHPGESFVRLHLVFWGTRRRWTAGKQRKPFYFGLFPPYYCIVDKCFVIVNR